jgi:prepilin-type N-terminal cleavage/methylation domain-containing protein
VICPIFFRFFSQVRRSSGFTLVEVLVVIGILALVGALIVPTLAGVRSRARATVTLSNIKQMGQGVVMYAASAKDRAPCYAEPAWPPIAPWTFDYGKDGGWWFDHWELYSLEITSLLESTRIARASGHVDPPGPVTHRGNTASLSDFFLTNTLYASPKFFNWKTHAGPEQFGLQQLSSIAFPSDKGLLMSMGYWHSAPHYGLGCCGFDIPMPLVFADLSASEISPVRMKPGILNIYARVQYSPNADPRVLNGMPVFDTVDGIQGRDRPSGP